MKLRHKKMARAARRNLAPNFAGINEAGNDGNARFAFLYRRTQLMWWHFKYRSVR